MSWIEVTKGEVLSSQFDEIKERAMHTLNMELESTELVFDSISQNYLLKPLPHDRHSCNPNVILGKDGSIVSITVPVLVRHLRDNFESLTADCAVQLDSFFLLFRYFYQPKKLIDLLIARYNYIT
jgi:hypothetical protein